MAQFQITALHHVQLAIPVGRENVARAFYAGVLGMKEVPKPEALRARGGVWFESGSVALHLGVEDPFIAAKKAHPAFEVADLAGAHAVLADHGVSQITALPGLRRFYVADPFGNRIEIVQRD